MNRKDRRIQGKSGAPRANAATAEIAAAFAQALRHHQAGELAQAEALYRRVLAADARHSDALHMLGVAAHQQGRSAEAIDSIGKAIATNPKIAAYRSNLGHVLKHLGRLEEAVVAYDAAIRLQPDLLEAHANLGNALKKLGRLDDAVAAFNAALRIKPNDVETLRNLGIALTELGRLEDAVDAFTTVLRLKPDFADAYYSLAVALKYLLRLEEATVACNAALRLKPHDAHTHTALAMICLEEGRFGEVAAHLERALAAKPDYEIAWINRLYLSTYDPATSAETRREMHAAWAAAFADRHFPAPLAHANAREPQRRLKIGYVSPDFRTHSVAPFVAPLLRHHDRRNVEVYAYSAVRTPDAETARLRAMVDVWRPIRALNDDAAAALVRADGIDILIDLAAHTADNRLGLFARKPAPVQATWLGYGSTTGMKAIDWFVSDATIVPEGTESAFVERVWRLPNAYAFEPQAALPDVAPAPARTNGFVTFGHFGRLARVTDDVLRVWARILARVPTARLALNTPPLGDAGVRARIAARFAQAGGDVARLDLWATRPQPKTWQAYGLIDVALDPFPVNAGATTFEALWLGVPVVSLRAAPPLGRMGQSILTAAGLEDWVAGDIDAYVERAVRAAEDPAGLRATLRSRLAASALLDAKTFTAHFETALRGMWQLWCQIGATRV
jgi:protein O-GlcNAc transferase